MVSLSNDFTIKLLGWAHAPRLLEAFLQCAPSLDSSDCVYSTGLGDGAVAGIVIAVLIVAGLAILGTIAVIYYTKTHSKRATYG